jgi:16S rRNA (cytosine1402-N4)-methyltransferase
LKAKREHGLTHTTVLLGEAVDALLGQPPAAGPQTFVDATFGSGGHSRLILARLRAQDRLIAFDKDPQAVASAAHTSTIPGSRSGTRVSTIWRNWRQPAVAGILMDLGVSSPQIDDPSIAGFSFRFDGPLDMRMDTTRGQSVAQWLPMRQVNPDCGGDS